MSINDTLAQKRRTEASIEQTAAAFMEKAHRLEQHVVETKDRVRDSLDVRERTRERPLQMVGIAFGLGFVFGWRS